MKPPAFAALLTGLLALAQPVAAAERRLPALPAPTGPHALGTLVVDWTDEMREESWTSDPEDRRRLVVQFWYPAAARPARVPAPYVLRYPQLRESLAHLWDERLPAIVTHAALEEPVLEEEGLFPVLVFSHGMNASRTFYTALIEELASHGYVVAAIEHTHWGPGVAFSNGRTVGFEDGMPALDWLASNEMDELVQDGVATMAEDQAFVARMLSRLVQDDRYVARELGRRMDLRRVGVLGHGMGGMAAVRSGFTYAPFKAIATLDGYAWSMGGLAPHGSPAATSNKPLLVLLSGGGVHGDSVAFARRHLAAFESPSVVRIAGTLHGSPSDWGLLDEGARRDAALAAHRRVSATVRAFFDDRLARRGSFVAALQAVPGARPVDLTQMLNTATRAATR